MTTKGFTSPEVKCSDKKVTRRQISFNVRFVLEILTEIRECLRLDG